MGRTVRRRAKNAPRIESGIVQTSLEVNVIILKKAKPPTTQRKFAGPWAELDYLCKKIHYWLYTRKKKPRAERYRDRLEQVIDDLPENDLAIIRYEALALLHELRGNLSQAILCRTREIELIERLHVLARSPRHDERTRAYMLQNCGEEALQHRRDILQSLKDQKLRPTSNGVGTGH